MYDTVLVPTDGSDAAERAGAHAASLADAFDATVHALGVVDVAAAAGPFDAGGVDEEYVDRLEADAERAVESVASRTDGPVETAVIEGDTTETIRDYADREGVGLVAMGTHGRSALGRALTGSTSARVVRESSVPVVTTRPVGDDGDGERADPAASTDYDDVLVPTDGSPPADAAVGHGLAVAEAFDATVHAVNVVEVGALAAGPDATVAGGGTVGSADLLDALAKGGEDATEHVADRARERGLEATTEVIEGSPGSTLLSYVDEEAVDFVTMGTHGHSGLERVLLGSTTEQVMRHSSAPVLSVRSSES